MLNRSGKVRGTTLAVGIGAAAASLVLAGCGGSSDNGEAKKTGPQVASDAAAAIKASSAFHVAGTVTEDGKPSSIDMQIQNNDVSGTMTMQGAKLNLVIVGGKVYIKGDSKFWSSNNVPAQTAALLGGRWVIAPASSADEFKTFSATGLADDFEHPTDGPFQNDVHKAKVDGKSVVVVTQKDGSELDVAAKGKPYPVRAVSKGDQTGTLTFSGWDQTQPIKTPPSPLNLDNSA
jgi:hypothetical protein